MVRLMYAGDPLVGVPRVRQEAMTTEDTTLQILADRLKTHPRMEPVLPEFAGPDYKPSWIMDMTMKEYHSELGHVSSSGLRKALVSAATFREYCRPQEEDKPEPDHFRIGRLVHQVLMEPKKALEGFRVMPDFGDMRSSTNRAIRDTWLKDLPRGTTPCKESELRDTLEMVESVLRHPEARILFEKIADGGKGIVEASGFYADEKTGLQCRVRPDFLRPEIGLMVDVKTALSSEREEFSKSLFKYGYHIQMAMYCEGARRISGHKIDLPTFVVVEKEPPFEVAVYTLDCGAMDFGSTAMERGLETIANGVRTGVWPGRQPCVQNISIPHWAFNQEGT